MDEPNDRDWRNDLVERMNPMAALLLGEAAAVIN
jgi:hypothetical protein